MDFDAGGSDFFAGHHRPASGALYSDRQIAGGFRIPLSWSKLHVSGGDHDHFFVIGLAALPSHLTKA